MPGSIPKSILKNVDRDKKLPAVPPPSPHLLHENGRVNYFIPGNFEAAPFPSSSRFHPRSKVVIISEGLKLSESRFLKSSSMYEVNKDVDERPWIRGGSSSAPPTRAASQESNGSIHRSALHVVSFQAPDLGRSPNRSYIPVRSPMLGNATPRSRRMSNKHKSSNSSRRFRHGSRIPRYAGSTSRSQPASAAPSRSASRHSHSGKVSSPVKGTKRRNSLRNSSKIQSIAGLRLSTKRASVANNSSAPNSALNVVPSRGIPIMASSPLLVSASQAKLQRRPRVCKRGSISEADEDPTMPSASIEDNTLTPRPLHPAPGKSFNSVSRYSSSPALRLPTSKRSPTRRSPRLYDDIGTVHSLPLILPADQEYECRVEWESEGEPEVDAAEKLWKRLEDECGMASPARLGDDIGLIPRRGRWKVNVVETPVIPMDECQTEQSTDGAGDWVAEELDDVEVAGSEEGFIGVLREIEDLMPPIQGYKRLAAMMDKGQRSRSRKGSRRSIKRAMTRKVVHSDIKRTLRGVWENETSLDAEHWTSRLEMLRSLSTAASAMTRSNSRWTMAKSNSHWGPDAFASFMSAASSRQGQTGLGITMLRSATLKSEAADSMLDYYFD